jgi:hypothetical protein
MPTLRQCLEALPHRDVRGIATRLGVRRRGVYRKEDWIEAIVQAWLTAASQAQIMASLSPAALGAAGRLAQGGACPTPLFLAEYGAVRRPQPGQHWTPPPWDTPQTISEELYYCGLLVAAPPALLQKAVRLALPTDLQALFAAAPLRGQPPVAATDAGAAAAFLLHDVAQTLCFLLEQPGLLLLHGRWLAPTALANLNGRLLRPERLPLPRAHARARRLRSLFFLATAAGLLSDGHLTPLGWAWLAEPAAARLTRLWNAWRTAPLPLRQAYRQVTAVLPAPWPDLALKHLGDLPPAFTARQLAQAVLGQEAAFAAYFTAHLSDLAALDAAAASLIDALVADWGALAPAAPLEPAGTFGLTALGRWLIAPAHGDPPGVLAAAPADPAAWLDVQEAAGWQLRVAPAAPPLPLAHLAAYARHIDLTVPQAGSLQPGKGDGGIGGDHIYWLDVGTVAGAAAVGHGLPDLLQAFVGLGVQLTPQQQIALQAWHARGHELQLLALPLLRTARPELLAQLLGHADVRVGLGELLAPTVAVAALPPADLAARLAAAGFFVQGSGIRVQTAGDRRQEPEANVSASPPQFPASGSQPPQFPAALWLAGQLYAALGQHITLPLPPPFADLTTLLSALPPPDQAVVQALWETLRSDLLALLDGRTFAPPPEPSDPACWRARIEAAVAAGRALTLNYFTAGRNVLTQRTVTPYWIEEHRGIPYLRADCHLAGRVRLFRLDRIQEIQESGDRDQESVRPLPPDS